MTTFLLIRHAEHTLASDVLPGRLPGVHLSEHGQQQAVQLAARIDGLPLAALYCSALYRAMETAEAIAYRCGVPVQVSDGFAEIDYGEWSGQSIGTLTGDQRWQAWNNFRSGARLPGGGSMLEVQSRVVAEMQRLCDRHPEQLVAVVSHADVIKAAIAAMLGISLDYLQRIEISLASISVVALHKWGAQVLRLNDTLDLGSAKVGVG